MPSWTTEVEVAHEGRRPQAMTSSSLLTPLLPVLESLPQIFTVAFRPLLNPHTLLSPSNEAPITDVTTLYIPASVREAKTPELSELGKRMHAFGNEAAHVSHEAPGPMSASSRGLGVDLIERKGRKMVVHVLLHSWGSKEEE